MKRFLLILLTIAIALAARCGGGFSADSPNAADVAPTVFGPPADSTAR